MEVATSLDLPLLLEDQDILPVDDVEDDLVDVERVSVGGGVVELPDLGRTNRDYILLEDGRIAPFSRSHPTCTAMGRFGHVLLVSGEPELSLRAKEGEVVRFYLTNTANTGVFNVSLRGARMTLVGGDSGHCEREAFVEGVLIGLMGPRCRRRGCAIQPGPGQHRTPKKHNSRNCDGGDHQSRCHSNGYRHCRQSHGCDSEQRKQATRPAVGDEHR